ncbi:MAG: rRNA pseudouridine synthase [Candidatus Omnitrophica bacterium]|nr:rRNA pseudouridine synthase [Candidatus Omnitrophota bacterium]
MKHSDKDNSIVRLQVYLSRNGVCSRREAMSVIKEGRVRVNGAVVTEPSTPVSPESDTIKVDGKVVQQKEYIYLLLNKAKGYVTTRSGAHREKTVYDLVPKQYSHLVPVGRLDKETEGLLLLTNDGDTAYKLTHPKFDVDKTYFVRVQGELDIRDKQRVMKGIYLEGKRTSPAVIKGVKANKKFTDFYMIIHEGRKRQIRMMMAKVGYKVIYLKRIAQGPLKLGDLKTGAFRLLNKKEKEALERI